MFGVLSQTQLKFESLECRCANVSDNETMNLSYMKWRIPQKMTMEKAMFKGIQGEDVKCNKRNYTNVQATLTSK